MRTRRPGRLSAAATRRLLDGGDGPPPLAQILAAATAPSTVTELRGESAARAAFRSSPHSTPFPHDVPRRFPVHAASTFMIAKAVAAVALAASTAGGIALATTSTPADPHALTTREAAAGDGAPPSAVVLATRGPVAGPARPDEAADAPVGTPADRHDSADATARTTPAARAAHPTGLCRASENIATDGHAGKAAESPAFTDVDCADADAGARPVPPSDRPSTAPGDPGHRTGKPDTTDRARDDTDTGNKSEKAGKSAEGQGNAARTGNGDHGEPAGNRRNG
jgi:hypothetical protein